MLWQSLGMAGAVISVHSYHVSQFVPSGYSSVVVVVALHLNPKVSLFF